MKSGSTELEVVKSAALSGAQERNSYRKKKMLSMYVQNALTSNLSPYIFSEWKLS